MIKRLTLFSLCYWILGALVFLSAVLDAEVRTPAIFSSGMILQRSATTPVWGTADFGESISVNIAGESASVIADESGRWMVRLDLSGSMEGPLQMTIEGNNRIVFRDVLIGEVWLASGQSNMEFPLRLTDSFITESKKPANENIREFKVRKNIADQPTDEIQGHWLVAGPLTIDSMSGVSYHFASRLQEVLGCPVGIINSSYGGTCVETWMSAVAIDSNAELKAGGMQADADYYGYPERMRRYSEACGAWMKAQQREDRMFDAQEYVALGVDTSDWKTVQMPGQFGDVGLPENGALWLRKRVPITSDLFNQDMIVNIGLVRDYDQVYWNGELVGETSIATPLASLGREYRLPPTAVGESVLAVRVLTPLTRAGILANRGSFRVGNDPSNMFYLEGDWLAKVEFTFQPLATDVAAPPSRPSEPYAQNNLCSRLYNGMIHPLVPFGVRGVIWYQGESNETRAFQYRDSFPLLIQSWRHAWGTDFPFYFCQLTAFRDKVTKPGESSWAEVRESQSLALELPATGQAVLIDAGESMDIHPQDKKTAGERLASIALAKTYGEDCAFSGPVFKAAEIESGTIRVSFNSIGNGLHAKPLDATYPASKLNGLTKPLILHVPDSKLQGFSICGSDKQWYWAHAQIDGETVIVKSEEVPEPIAVRYAWQDNPTANLFSQDNFPAAPFRSDDFLLTTRNVKYPK